MFDTTSLWSLGVHISLVQNPIPLSHINDCQLTDSVLPTAKVLIPPKISPEDWIYDKEYFSSHIDPLLMSSFTSFIPGFNANTDRLNPGRKRPAPPRRVNDFEVARQSQRNEMFFTEEDDDADSLFGTEETPVIERNNSRLRQSQPQNQAQSKPPVRGSQVQPRHPAQGNATVGTRQDPNAKTNRPVNNSMRPPTPQNKAPTPTVNTVPQTIQIKDEESDMDTATDTDYLRNIPPSQRVKIFIGRKNRSIDVNRADLSKSPTLLSYVVDDPVQGSFIMRPQLMTTHYDDFVAVSRFLRAGEYAPLLLENPTDQTGPKILNGLKSDEDYAKELVKSGKLYGLAKGFGVQGMAELVFKKVSEVDAGKFSIDSLVRLTEVAFKDATNGGGNGSVGGEGGTNTPDPLEDWIVEKLAYNFQEIMRTQREKFFEVVKVTGKKMLFARVLEEVATKYRASGGKLPEPVIELD